MFLFWPQKPFLVRNMLWCHYLVKIVTIFFINIKLYKTFQLEHLSSHLQHKKTTQKECLLFPTIVLYHMNHFDNKLPFFVFLAIFKGMFLNSHKKMYDIRFTVNKKYQRRQSERAECNLHERKLARVWPPKIRSYWMRTQYSKLSTETYVFPSQCGFTAFTINVRNSM